MLGVPNLSWPSPFEAGTVNSDVPASINGTRLIQASSFAGGAIKFTVFAKSNTAGANKWRTRLQQANGSSEGQVLGPIITEPMLVATDGTQHDPAAARQETWLLSYFSPPFFADTCALADCLGVRSLSVGRVTHAVCAVIASDALLAESVPLFRSVFSGLVGLADHAHFQRL